MLYFTIIGELLDSSCVVSIIENEIKYLLRNDVSVQLKRKLKLCVCENDKLKIEMEVIESNEKNEKIMIEMIRYMVVLYDSMCKFICDDIINI